MKISELTDGWDWTRERRLWKLPDQGSDIQCKSLEEEPNHVGGGDREGESQI